MDDLLGELHALKTRVNDSDELGRRLSEQLSGEIDSMHSKLETAQFGLSQESTGDESAAIMGKINSKISQLQSEINDLKVSSLVNVYSCRVMTLYESVESSSWNRFI